MLKIDKDIPRPNRRYGFSKGNQEIYDAMVKAEVGDSFIVPNPGRSLASFVSRQSIGLDKKFMVSRSGDQVRMWRIK